MPRKELRWEQHHTLLPVPRRVDHDQGTQAAVTGASKEMLLDFGCLEWHYGLAFNTSFDD